MTDPIPDDDPIVAALTIAARDRDAVRAAYLMTGVYDTDGTVQFPKATMLTLWKAQFPSDNGTGGSSVTNRLSRASQVLARTIAVARDGQTLIITDDRMVRWLGDRNALIAGMQPGMTDLFVSPDDLAMIALMLAERDVQPQLDGVGAMNATAAVTRNADTTFDGSGIILTADAQVVRNGQVVDD